VFEVAVDERPIRQLRSVLDPTDYASLESALSALREVLDGRRIWHVNSTPRGGGVAELLSTLLPYAADAGVDVRWVVIEGRDDEFFDLTKRIHNMLHESDDVDPPRPEDRVAYEDGLGDERDEARRTIARGDVVVLHDPQTAGLAPTLVEHGATVVWRCHVGTDAPGPLARGAWDLLREDVAAAHQAVFTRSGYAWDGLDPDRISVMVPCIDVVSPKNRPLGADAVGAMLHRSAIFDGDREWPSASPFELGDGRSVSITRRARIVDDLAVPSDASLVVQVSRWDRLKDPAGLMHAFVDSVLPAQDDAHLVLAGPETEGVDDDPESALVFGEVRQGRQNLSSASRAHVHLVELPMDDEVENSLMVNALQHRADVVVQKSLAEGFGLTVAEAMWKQRPVVASRVGGIQDQIVDGESGLLLDDPNDAEELGRAVNGLLADRARADSIGAAARRRVCDHFLPTHHFQQEAAVIRAAWV
jgi:trehalose synthase